MKPKFFATAADLRAWLEAHHETEKELLVGFHKKTTGKRNITWPESVDEALCFDWIDGVRRRLNESAYTIRFTPRTHGHLLLRTQRVGEADESAGEDSARKPEGLRLLRRATAPLSQDGDPLGHQRQEG